MCKPLGSHEKDSTDPPPHVEPFTHAAPTVNDIASEQIGFVGSHAASSVAHISNEPF